MSLDDSKREPREPGHYWVCTYGDTEPEVARWDGNAWDFCGAESIGYAEPDDPTGKRVRVVSARLTPPSATQTET